MSEKLIDVDELLPRIENLGGVASRAEVAAAMRQLRDERGRLLLTIQEAGCELNEIGAELDKAATELAAERQRADSADAALAESDAVWRHSVAESRRALEVEHDQRIARLTERAEKAEAAVVATADAAQYQRIRAERAEADILRERQAAYHARQQCDAARKAFDEKREECDQWKQLGAEALDAVDRVFQVDSTKPPPLLPYFLLLGESKFSGVVKLAEAYLELREECDRLRSCAHGAIAADYDAACELLYGSGDNQLAKRVAELVAERDRLRAERPTKCEGERQCPTCKLRWYNPDSDLCPRCMSRDFQKQCEKLRAERPTMEAEEFCNEFAKAHRERGLPYTAEDIMNPKSSIGAMVRVYLSQHFAPLAADDRAVIEVTMPQCDHCGKPSTHSIRGDGSHWWFCDECLPPDGAKYASVPEMLRGIADDIEAKPAGVGTTSERSPRVRPGDADSPPAASTEWVERIVKVIDDIWQLSLYERDELRYALAPLFADGNSPASTASAEGPRWPVDEGPRRLGGVTVPDDLSASCVADEDIRRGEGK